MAPDEIAHGLRRLADYSPGVTKDERQVVLAAAAALSQPDPLRDLNLFERVLVLLSNPADTSARIAEFRKAAADAVTATAAATAAAAALGTRKAAFEAELAEHQATIERERTAHEAAMAARENGLRARETALAESERAHAAERAQTTRAKSDLERRLNVIKDAAA